MLLSDAASAHTLRWVRALADRGFELRLFSLRPAPAGVYDALERVEVTWAGIDPAVATAGEGASRKLTYLRALPRLRKAIRAWRPDVVHAHYASSYGLLATLAGARPRVVSVWGLDVYSFPERSLLHRWVMHRVLAGADQVLSTSNAMKRRVLELASCPVTVTPFGVDMREFGPANVRAVDEEALVVGTVKSLEPKYGIEFLLRAFAVVTQNGTLHPRWRLVIVGGGSLRDTLEALAGELGIAPQVHFAGPCPAHEAADWHRSFDVAVYPSTEDSESFGVAAVESQACAVPVIVSRVGGLPEVVVDGMTGLVVPPSDPAALASALLSLLRDPERRRGMGAAARRHVEQRFSLAACTDIMAAVYANQAGGRCS